MIRKHLIFHGSVQGVGFRYYCVSEARRLGLTGWVRNLCDGTVEAEIQGSADAIRSLIDYMSGRDWIEITDIEEKNIPVRHEHTFRERW